jgi:hypothetical protein
VIVAADNEWVQGLSKFRGGMFHEEAEAGPAIHRLSFRGERHEQVIATVHLHLPATLVAELKAILPPPDGNGNVDIVEGARAVGVRAIQTASAVVNALASSVAADAPSS